jgi:hypothetical protein
MAVSEEQRREIELIQSTLASAMDELASLLSAGKADDAQTVDTMMHAHEMAEILTQTVYRLDGSNEAERLRAYAVTLCARLATAERDLARSRLH